MTSVEFLPNAASAVRDAKAKAALQDLDQAWAYYTPEPLTQSRDSAAEQASESFVPYYDAA